MRLLTVAVVVVIGGGPLDDIGSLALFVRARA